jgi:hypothetical protein
MTPIHERLVDELLQQFFRRSNEHTSLCGLGRKQPPTPEQLRASPIGQHIMAIAQFAEGHSYPASGEWHDVRDSIAVIHRAFFGNPLDKTFYLPPPKLHLTPLGQLLNDALVRFYRSQGPGTLLPIGNLMERFQVSRQTIHQWIEDRKITPVYVDGTTRFYLPDVERLQQQIPPRPKKEKRISASIDAIPE